MVSDYVFVVGIELLKIMRQGAVVTCRIPTVQSQIQLPICVCAASGVTQLQPSASDKRVICGITGNFGVAN